MTGKNTNAPFAYDDMVHVHPRKEPVMPGHLDRWVDGVEDSCADLYLQCVCYQRVYHPSKA